MITPDNIIAMGALLGACGAIITAVFKLVRWFDRQRTQDADIKAQGVEIQALREALEHRAKDDELQAVKDELQVLCFSMLACLDGLKQLGANGNVTKAHDKLDKHLNKKAHE